MIARPLKIRNIPARIDPDLLGTDLEDLVEVALKAGAEDAAIINSRDVIFNPDLRDQVSRNARYPSCHWPARYPRDSIEEAIRAYQQGIFFFFPNRKKFRNYRGGPIPAPGPRKAYQQVYETVSLVESTAFYLGYHLALGLASGNCRSIFCPDEPRCSAMVKGQRCIHPVRSRPAMEAVGIDARALARQLKGKVPARESTAFLAGLVMIA